MKVIIFDIDNAGPNETRKEIGHFEFTLAKIMTSLKMTTIGDLECIGAHDERGKVILTAEVISCFSINEISLNIQCHHLISKKKREHI